MGDNKILPFAETDTGSNLLSQAEYDSDSQRLIGNQPGIARSKLVNKVLRQASIIAGGLAQYIADRQPADVTDTLPVAGVADCLRDAIGGDIQKGAVNTAIAGGTADAITASFTPPITAPTNGMLLLVRAAGANVTPTPTFSPNSGVVAAKTIVKGNNLPLVAGDISGNGHWLALQYDSALDKWVLLNPASPITGHGVQKFDSNGSFTVPPGISTIWVSACGGGGGGGAGGCRPTTSQFGGGGSGGGAGQSCIQQPLSVVPGSVINVTIGGAGGGGVAVLNENGTSGTAGGPTSIGAYISLAGGCGGGGGGGASGNAGGTSAGEGYPRGSNGIDGNLTAGVGTGNGGMGASSPFGGGGGAARSTQTGSAGGYVGMNAGGYGAGGGGGSTGINSAGGAGSPGLVIIEW